MKDQRIAPERKKLILRAVEIECLGFLRVAHRVLEVSRNLIADWLVKKPEICRT